MGQRGRRTFTDARDGLSFRQFRGQFGSLGGTPAMTPQQYGPLIGIAVIVILLRNRQKRTLGPELMWILPSIFIPLMEVVA